MPEGLLTRQLQWRLEQWRLQQPLADYNDAMREALEDRLPLVEEQARGLAGQLYGEALPEVPRRSGQQLLTDTFVLAKRLSVLFNRDVASGESLFMRQQRIAIERAVQGGLMQELPNEELAERMVKVVRTPAGETGRSVPGTLFNKLRARLEAVVNAAIWTAANNQLQRSFKRFGAKRWEWHAVLDPRTCPICWELDGRIEDKPSDFPEQPAVHPNCRCVLLPVLS
jgi:SPP1 gp7 family putative phage head morphogenesis protein